jgi:hypothetical protein
MRTSRDRLLLLACAAGAALAAATATRAAPPDVAPYATNEIILPNLYSLKRKIQWNEGGGHRVVRTEHFDVVVHEGEEELGARIAGIAEPWYEEMKRRLGVDPDAPLSPTDTKRRDRIPLIAYTSLSRFQETNTIPGFLPEGVQGFFEFIKGRIVLPHTGSNALLEHVTRHEIVHAFALNMSERMYLKYQDDRRLARSRRGVWNRLAAHARRLARDAPRGTFGATPRAVLYPKGTEVGLPNRAAAQAAAGGRALLAPRVFVGWPEGADGRPVEGPLAVSVEMTGATRVAALGGAAAFDSLRAALAALPDSVRAVVRRVEWPLAWETCAHADTLLDAPAREAAADTARLRAALAAALEPAAEPWARRRPEVALAAAPAARPADLAAAAAPLWGAYDALSRVPIEPPPSPWPPPDESYSAAEDSLFAWIPPSLKPRLLPLALNEGAAEFYGSDWDALEEMVLRDALFTNRIVPIDRLGPQHGYLVYVEGESFLRYLARLHGDDAVSLFLRSIYLGPTMSSAAHALFGASLADLSKDWEEDLRRRLYPSYAERDAIENWAERLTHGPFDTFARRSGATTVYKRARRGRSEVVARSERGGGAGGGASAPARSGAHGARAEAPGVVERVLARDQKPGTESLHLLQGALDVRGSRVALGVQVRGRDRLRVLDLDGREPRREHAWDEILSITSVSISPDGQRAALAALDRLGHADLFVASLETGALERLTEDFYEDAAPDWGERGIVFSSDRESEGSHDLYRIDPDGAARGTAGGEPRVVRITATAWNETEPSWLPGGSGLVALSDEEGVPNIVLIDPEGSSATAAGTTAATPLTSDRVGVAHLALGDGHAVVSAFGGLRMRIWEAPLDSLVAAAAARRAARAATSGAVPESAPAMPLDSALVPAAVPATGPDASPPTPPRAFWRPTPPPAHEVLSYRPRYGADLLLVNATTLSTGAYFGLSDLLGNRQIALVLGSNAGSSESFTKFLNVGVVYGNLEGRTDWRLGFLRTGNEFLTEEEGFFFERDVGALFGMTHPIDRFRSVSWDLIASTVQRETPGEPTDNTAEVALQTVIGHDTAVPDDYGYGYGSGLLTSLLLSVDYRVTAPTGWRSATAIYDVRHYVPIVGRVFLAVRASYGLSTGRVPDRIRLGGSWTLRGFKFNDLQGDRFALGNVELRFPMPVVVSIGPVSVVRAVQGALFADAGDAWFASSGSKVKGSIGLGFRMGLAGTVLRYDISKRYDERKGGFQDGTRGDLFVGYNF